MLGKRREKPGKFSFNFYRWAGKVFAITIYRQGFAHSPGRKEAAPAEKRQAAAMPFSKDCVAPAGACGGWLAYRAGKVPRRMKKNEEGESG